MRRGVACLGAKKREVTSKGNVSGSDFDGSAGGDEGPYLIDFLISDGDAAEGPVVNTVGGADEALAVGEAMDHDVAARGDAEAGGALAVIGVGVGDVKRLVVVACGVAVVDDVMAFGGAGVALSLFGSETAGAERDFVSADNFAGGE